MEKIVIKWPIVQVAIDLLSIDAALRMGEIALRAGADWLEAGTPLITYEGVRAIGALAREFPGVPVLADYKMMDGAFKYVIEAGRQGGRIATICGVASDASIRAAERAAEESGVALIVDLYAAPDVGGRAAEMEAIGVDSVYVHWGSDQRVEQPERDPFIGLSDALERVSIPVGVGTFSVADGARASRAGATIGVIGYPLLGETDVESALRAYVDAFKSAR